MSPSAKSTAEPVVPSAPPILGIELLSCQVAKSDNLPSQMRYEVALTRFARHLDEQKATLCIKVGIDIMSGIEDPACSLLCEFQIVYTRPGETPDDWDQTIKDHIALAHLVPYVREFVSNMTGRMGLRPLLLPPLNTSGLLRKLRSPNT